MTACASQPEIPKIQQTQANEQQKIFSNRTPQSVGQKQIPLKKWKQYLVQTEIRSPETDCQVYSQPNLYSDRVDTAKAGNEVWTEDTGSTWYKVYKNQKYGYVSKICFTN